MTTAALVGDGPDVPRSEPSDAAPWGAWKRRAVTYGPLVVVVAFVAERTIAAVLAKTGHPAAALDDAYIHFQYARAIASGHPLRFEAGEPVTSGATSMLWPAALAPFWLLGARGGAIMWAAWALSFMALGGLAWEASRLTERLAGPVAALGAAAMTVTFGGFVWCAASGMEVVPFAWAIARATRLASEWGEAEPQERTARRFAELVAMAWVAALFRPEGGVAALFVGATLAVFPRRDVWKERAYALMAASSVFALPLLLWATTGSPRTNTAVVKLLPGNPYFTGAALTDAIAANAKMLVGKLLNGEIWSAEFLPHNGAPIAMAGLGAIAVVGNRSGARWRAAGVIVLALTMFAPCFYFTFLWNRLRYLWPFATGWIIGLACLARLAGDVAGLVRPRWRAVTGIACGAVVGLFVSKLEWVIDDVAQSASGIDRQQVTLGHWANEHLGPEVRIGVNDTGAIAYFGERTTFDIVGLTTENEARYWVAGAGSRFEHYERLHATDPGKLPTHFIVYPTWMAMDSVLGATLTEATVTDSSILGGQTMGAYVADWSKLGSGEQPWTPTGGDVVDTVDVADLESERDHDYALFDAHDLEQTAHEGFAPNGATVVDGGRTERSLERFTVRLPQGLAVRGIVRLIGKPGTRVQVLANERPIDAFELGDDQDWVERSFEVPSDAGGAHTTIELRAESAITTFHYWFVKRRIGLLVPPAAARRVTPG